MPDRDDMPGPGLDPLDEAYLRAEQALDDEGARAARRARVLAAAAGDAGARAPALRRPIRRYGGWLAAACVAGVSVWTAQKVYRPAPPPAQDSTAAVTPPAPAASAPTAPAARSSPPQAAPPQAAPTPRILAAPPPIAVRRRPPIAEPAPPPADVAPPPPLPIPPVEKPIAPPPPLAAAPAATAKSGLDTQDSVVVTGSRAQRRSYAAPAPMIAGALESKAVDGPARLREAAAAGRTADIETLLAQGVLVDAADETGETALMKSIAAGQRDAAALLRRHGASLDQKNRAGVSARDLAATKADAALDQALGLSP
jgi:hypothetical protein